MKERMCDYAEEDAKCIREKDHLGLHIVERADGKRYVDWVSMEFIGHAKWPEDDRL